MAYQFTRIAVKIGSNVLARKDGTPDVTRLSALVDQIAELQGRSGGYFNLVGGSRFGTE